MMQNLAITLVHLYPKSMNTYGDLGNVYSLQQRCKWRGIKCNLVEVEVGEDFDMSQADIVFAGGGQDNNQLRIAADLQLRKGNIIKAVNNNIIFLIICGTYQLFGHYFLTSENEKIEGISVFDCITKASVLRKIGNVIIEHNIEGLSPKTLVGFENHSGNTFINKSKIDINSWKKETVPFAKVIQGFGNNGEDTYEGARYKNCFGTYLHGSLLPKNPHFADYLINMALTKKYGNKIILDILDDTLEYKAHNHILNQDHI